MSAEEKEERELICRSVALDPLRMMGCEAPAAFRTLLTPSVHLFYAMSRPLTTQTVTDSLKRLAV